MVGRLALNQRIGVRLLDTEPVAGCQLSVVSSKGYTQLLMFAVA